nr:response regulator transcription factor [Actinomycetota bacterium]
MRTLRVVMVDDHRLMLDALLLALRDAEGIELVGDTNEGRRALPLVGETNPDVVLLDFRMPDMDGLAVLDRIRKHHPDVKVIMLSGSDDPELIQDALRRGASAFILKQIDPRDLPGAIRQAVEGTIYSAIGRAEEANGGPDSGGLTPKELDVLSRVARGLSNKEISKELWLSEQTIKFHLTNIYRKLGVGNRTEAARFAYQQGLIRPYEDMPFTPGS